jgi:hypothetical protein
MRKLELSLAVAAGFLGVALSHYVCSPLVHAQAQVLAPKEVRSQSFVLTDDKGAVQGVFTFEKPQGGSATIVLRDSRGHRIWKAGGRGIELLESSTSPK